MKVIVENQNVSVEIETVNSDGSPGLCAWHGKPDQIQKMLPQFTNPGLPVAERMAAADVAKINAEAAKPAPK